MKRSFARHFAIAALVGLGVGGAHAATFLVTSGADSGASSLRDAITQANASPGADAIEFSPDNLVITLTSGPLPTITEQLRINVGTVENFVEVNGGGAAGSGLVLNADGCEVYGLWLHNFTQDGIQVNSNGCILGQVGAGNIIGGVRNGIVKNGSGHVAIGASLIGVTPAFAADPPTEKGIVIADGSATLSHTTVGNSPNEGISISGDNVVLTDCLVGLDTLGNSQPNNVGILIASTADSTVIGSVIASQGNVISGNTSHGIHNQGTNTTIRNNFIGTVIDGTAARGNGDRGIYLNSCGGATVVSGNVVSASTNDGINANSTTGTMTIEDNIIGLDSTGTVDLGNGGHGVFFYSSTGWTIDGNTISGNGSSGIGGTLTNSLLVQNNIIGMNGAGTAAIGNSLSGIFLTFCNDGTFRNNLVSANGTAASGNRYGMRLEDSTGLVVQGNKVGTDIAEITGFGNTSHGISLVRSQGTVGGTGDSEGNLVAGNGGYGIEANITGADSQVYDNIIGGNTLAGLRLVGSASATVQGNVIGLNVAGTAAWGNGGGILAAGSGTYTIGGTSAAQRNVVSGNTGVGITVSNTASVSIRGNYVGLSPDGTANIANTTGGISLSGTGSTATVGGSTAGEGNAISGNQNYGIYVNRSGATIEGNLIGTNASGTGPLGNQGDGIRVTTAATSAMIANNTIAGNTDDGIDASGTITVRSNRIGVGSDGTTAVSNDSNGIDLESTATGSLIGGASAADGNIIGFNGANGIKIDSTGTTISNNSIGTNPAGIADLGNGANGILVGETASGDLGALVTANRIAHNTLDNIQIGSSASGVEIGANSIDGDCRFPISFAGSLPANDGLDADTGANNFQNHPVISPAVSTDTAITGQLSSAASTVYTIHLFASTAAHASGFGPGETWLGTTTASTDGSGAASWSLTTTPIASGTILTALAIAPNGDTSYFSPAVQVQAATGIADWQQLGD